MRSIAIHVGPTREMRSRNRVPGGDPRPYPVALLIPVTVHLQGFTVAGDKILRI